VASLKGYFLIASPKLMDPNFARTVVLLMQHDENGAMGVILNRPLSITVREACAQSAEVDCDVEAPLYAGGPCEGPLLALHTSAEFGDNEVLDGVWFVMERHQMEALLRDAPEPVKFIANYSGWGSGQLEAEIAEGSWLALPATQNQIFAPEESLWDKLITQATLGQWVKPDQIPDDPSLN